MATDFELFQRYWHLCFKIYLLFKIANWLRYFISLSMIVGVSLNKLRYRRQGIPMEQAKNSTLRNFVFPGPIIITSENGGVFAQLCLRTGVYSGRTAWQHDLRPRLPVCVLKQRLLVRTGVSARAVVQCRHHWNACAATPLNWPYGVWKEGGTLLKTGACRLLC